MAINILTKFHLLNQTMNSIKEYNMEIFPAL